MSSVIISGDTSGSVTLSAPATAGSNTIVLPSGSGTLTLPSGTGTVSVNGVNSNIVAGTAVASTSGTSIDFTSIPSWAKRITVMFAGVSTSGTSAVLIQLGAGSVTTTGYVTSTSILGASTLSTTASTAAILNITGNTATSTVYGNIIINNITGNTWVASYSGIRESGTTFAGGGGIALGGTLDRVRLTTANGTDTFDAGSINILYE
jgi:hypothetical protein